MTFLPRVRGRNQASPTTPCPFFFFFFWSVRWFVRETCLEICSPFLRNPMEKRYWVESVSACCDRSFHPLGSWIFQFYITYSNVILWYDIYRTIYDYNILYNVLYMTLCDACKFKIYKSLYNNKMKVSIME